MVMQEPPFLYPQKAWGLFCGRSDTMQASICRIRRREDEHVLKGLIPALALAVGALFFLMNAMDGDVKHIGLFSWKDEDIAPQSRQALLALCSAQGVSELYQNFDLGDEALPGFLEAAAAQDVAVYWLEGTPEWALASGRESLLRRIARIGEYNREHGGIAGIMLDVEPYHLSAWKEDGPEIMAQYVQSMEEAYALARAHGLSLLLCIPWYFDNWGYEAELEALFEAGDGVAVMNYLRVDEPKQIAFEAELARTHGKRLINVYELKPVGEAGLVKLNTYAQEGLDAARESFSALHAAIGYDGLSLALHDARSLARMAHSEGQGE